MPTLLKPGDTCDGHGMERLLAVGRSAEVWVARRPDGGLCAFKIMAVEGTDKAKARFAQEGEALVRVSHPSVVRVLGAGTWQGRVWLALELVEGETLAQKVRRLPGVAPPPLDDVLDWIQQLCEGLAAAHEQGIVHRDLSADNIMITREGRVRLLDFGTARMRSWGLKTTRDVQLGSKNMAPEQFRGAEACPSMDVYGLGYVIYQALAGVHPLGDGEITVMDAATFHLLNEPRPLQEMAPWAPADLVALTQQMTAKDPAQRPPSMRAVIARLQLLRRGLSAQVLHEVRSVPGLLGAPAMAATIPMAACDVPASAPAPAISAPPTSWPASSWPVTSAPATSTPGSSAPGTFGLATSAPGAPVASPAAPPGPMAADRMAMLPAAGTTLVSAMAPPLAGPASRVPQPSIVPAAPVDLRTTDVPVEGTARRSRVVPRRASVAALVLASAATLTAAGWSVARLGGPAIVAGSAARPAAPAPSPAPAPVAPSAAPAPTASASGSAATPSKAAPVRSPARHPPGAAPRPGKN